MPASESWVVPVHIARKIEVYERLIREAVPFAEELDLLLGDYTAPNTKTKLAKWLSAAKELLGE